MQSDSSLSTLVDEKLYLSGGELGLGRGKWNCNVYEIDTIRREVDIICQIPDKRRHHKSCCTKQTIYIAGGYDRYRCKRYEVFKMPLATGTSLTVNMLSLQV